MANLGVLDDLVHVARRSYTLACNWKVRQVNMAAWISPISNEQQQCRHLAMFVSGREPRCTDTRPFHVQASNRFHMCNCNIYVYAQVFCDNYLDGGYHVPIAHPGLASQLDLGAYANEIHTVASLQVGHGFSELRAA